MATTKTRMYRERGANHEREYRGVAWKKTAQRERERERERDAPGDASQRKRGAPRLSVEHRLRLDKSRRASYIWFRGRRQQGRERDSRLGGTALRPKAEESTFLIDDDR